MSSSESVETLVRAEVARQLQRDSWHTPKSAAAYIKLSKAHLFRCIRQGRGPDHVGTGRMMRFKQSSLDQWLAKGGGHDG